MFLFLSLFHSRAGVGISGTVQTLYYVEVTDDMRVSAGGGLVEEGELIEVFELPLQSAQTFVWDQSDLKPAQLIFAFMWFFQTKRPDMLLCNKATESGPKS